ncbi:hypothetical protein [Micromonospora sp. AMSO31t]|uniref:hypothetical protein n=1 Tax=Micromonospora sp. AMSO31t TaxID=2650566 RepID=UPI00124B8150|nr:hypothetical protein [Micromonospora sp. AMSO31t]KAB1916148.1 hypothetical protein F8274_01485 [Micromonospora sp. AMSO31t]
MHQTHVVEGTGTPPQNTRVITAGKLKALKAAIRQFTRAIASDGQYRNPADVERHLGYHKLIASTLIDTYTQTAYQEPPRS